MPPLSLSPTRTQGLEAPDPQHENPENPVPTDEMSESRQTHVTLHDIDPQALDQLVQFAYTAEIVVGEGNVQVRV